MRTIPSILGGVFLTGLLLGCGGGEAPSGEKRDDADGPPESEKLEVESAFPLGCAGVRSL